MPGYLSLHRVVMVRIKVQCVLHVIDVLEWAGYTMYMVQNGEVDIYRKLMCTGGESCKCPDRFTSEDRLVAHQRHSSLQGNPQWGTRLGRLGPGSFFGECAVLRVSSQQFPGEPWIVSAGFECNTYCSTAWC